MGGISSRDAREWLCDGKAFVTNDRALVGDAMLGWDFDHLSRHLPADQLYDVFLVRERLVMSHSVRYSTHNLQGTGSGATSSDEGAFAQAPIRFMRFAEFLELSAERERRGEGPRLYLGLDLLRFKDKQDSTGTRGAIGERLLAECGASEQSAVSKGSMFGLACLRAMQTAGELPALASMHLFVGSAATLCMAARPSLHLCPPSVAAR